MQKYNSRPFITVHTGVIVELNLLADMITDLKDWELNLLANMVGEQTTII